MDKFRFELNSAGVKDLLKSDDMQSALSGYASRVQAIAGSDYSTSVHVGKNRSNVSVYARTKKAKKDNLKNNTLLKALGSVKG